MSWGKSLVNLELISRLKQFPKVTVVRSQNAFTDVSSCTYSKCHACSPIINATITRQLSTDLTWKANKFNRCNCNIGKNIVVIFKGSNINSSAKRDFSSCTAHVFQKDPGSRNGNNKNGNIDNLEKQVDQLKAEEAYDPKKDSFFTQDTAYGSKENKGGGESERPVFIPPDENENKESSEDSEDAPTNCCQSGCPNCVWIEYVEKLTKKYSDPKMSRDKVLQELDALQDDNIKAFIMMELRIRKLI